MRYREFCEAKEKLDLPDIEIGDDIFIGKFKNRAATIKGFKTDDNNQPVLKTNKGDQKLFKPRIKKLMKDKNDNKSIKESISEFNIPSLGLESVISTAEANLPDEASRALDNFIGIPHNGKEMGYDAGIMSEHRLEDAYSTNPSERGKRIRAEIETAFKPVKTALKQKLGDVVRLYRKQESISSDKNPRNTLSWTIDKKIALAFAGIRKMAEPITDNQIKSVVDSYNSTGKAKFSSYEYIQMKDNPEYYLIYHNGEELTDGDDLQYDLKNLQKDRNELIQSQQEKLKMIIEAEIPLDSIIWVSDRSNQSEFIVMNTAGSSWHINNLGNR